MFLSKTFTTRNLAGLFEWPGWFVEKYQGRWDLWPDCAAIRCGPGLDVDAEDRSAGASSELPEDIRRAVPWSDDTFREIALYYLVPAGGAIRVRITKDSVQIRNVEDAGRNVT